MFCAAAKERFVAITFLLATAETGLSIFHRVPHPVISCPTKRRIYSSMGLSILDSFFIDDLQYILLEEARIFCIALSYQPSFQQLFPIDALSDYSNERVHSLLAPE